MRTIIRCPNCFTYVYQDARACHGCGERVGRRKILRAGSWVFIGLAVSAFTIARAIDLEQDKHWRHRREAEQAQRLAIARTFVTAWLTGDGQYESTACDREAFTRELAKLRERYPTVLPASRVVGDIRFVREQSKSHEMAEKGNGAITHTDWGEAEKKSAIRASCAPVTRYYGRTRRGTDGTRIRYSNWTMNSVEFEAEFTRNDAHYTVYGELCFDDQNKIHCLTIEKIHGLEDGVIPPRE